MVLMANRPAENANTRNVIISGATAMIRPSKLIPNRLLCRKQIVCDVIHPDFSSVPKTEIHKKLAAMYKSNPPSLDESTRWRLHSYPVKIKREVNLPMFACLHSLCHRLLEATLQPLKKCPLCRLFLNCELSLAEP
uniref:Small ribosomal subunit protein eS24 n=1 Tax=Glossina pallidipes TaxID=7398 RepID=A0A1B0A9B1_GLOPL